MAGRNERPIYEGQNRRHSERRKSDRYKKLLKYAAIAVITVLVIKLFHL